MEENKALEDIKTEQVSGGSEGTKRVCELCGGEGPFENYRITIRFTDSREYLGLKRICLYCRDTHLKDYIKKNYPGKALKSLDMEGPLAI